MVVYNTQLEESENNIKNYLDNIKAKKEFKSTSLPKNNDNEKKEEVLENPFLDISLRQFIDDFV